MEAACQRVLETGQPSYRSVKSLLEKGLDRAPLLPEPQAPAQPDHRNVRGAAYFKATLYPHLAGSSVGRDRAAEEWA